MEIEFTNVEVVRTKEIKFVDLPSEEFYCKWYTWLFKVSPPIPTVNKGKTFYYHISIIDDNSVHSVKFYGDTIEENYKKNDFSHRSIFAQLLVDGKFEYINKEIYSDRLVKLMEFHSATHKD